MNSKPLSNESLKTVIYYLDPNIRIKLSRRVPSIRITERQIPLRIQYLRLDSYKTVINDTEYELGVIRHFDDYEGYEIFKKDFDEGGLKYDLDDRGIPDNTNRKELLTGDVEIEEESCNSSIEYQRLEILEFTLSEYRRALEDEEKQNPEYEILEEVELRRFVKVEEWTTEQFMRDHMRYVPGEPPFHRVTQSTTNNKFRIEGNIFLRIITAGLTEEVIRMLIEKLEILIELTKKTELLFKTQLILKTKSSNETKIERFENRKINVSMKQLNNLFFANRPPIQVNHFETSSDKILRLPDTLKMKVENLKIGFWSKATINALKPILTESSFPLKSIRYPYYCFDDINNPIITTAHALFCDYDSGNRSTNAMNREVHIKHHYYFDIMEMLQNWKENDREVGRWYTFGMLLSQYLNHFNALKRSPLVRSKTIVGIEDAVLSKKFIFTMNNFTEVLIFAEKREEEINEQTCISLHFKILPLGSND